jgi:dienelactone hydrolase
MIGTRDGLTCAVALVSLLAPSALSPHAQEPTPGQIVDKVLCRSDVSQSYALFLPSSYSPQKKWPILYALDAGARGRLPVERFRDAAEKYGYIVAGSNNSRNGPPEIAGRAVEAMLDDTRARFAIDDRRIYFTGFSGGARVAVAVADSLKGLVAGVIGCGAGFPPQLTPSSSMPFAYFGTAGVEDFNYPEMKQLDRTLEGLGVRHRLATFQGGHDWLPPELSLAAIEWMELQAMRSGAREKNDAVIDELLHKAVQAAAANESSGNLYGAFLSYEAIVGDFAGLRDVAVYQRKADELKGSRDVQQSVRRELQEEDSQRQLMAQLMRLRRSNTGAENWTQVQLDLKSAISDVNSRANKKEDSEDRRVARRVRGQFLVQLREEATSAIEGKDYASAAFNLSLAVEVSPDNPRLFYNLACARALGGQKGDALSALKRAVEKGFTDRAALETDRDLDGLRKDPAFQRILDSLKK